MFKKINFAKYIFSWPVVYIYTVFIFIFSVLPVRVPAKVVLSDKIIHALVYMALSSLVANTLSHKKSKSIFLAAFLYAFILGLVIECVQFFIPFRSFELGDIFSNFLGSLIGSFTRVIK